MEASTETPRSLGQQLAAERERQGLSRVEMAQRLHMSPSQVEALESGEYARLPKGPFLRGFVRNYAKALGLEPASLVAQLAQDRPAESAPRIVVPSQNIRFDPLGERLANPYVKAAGLAFVAIALGFAAMYWWLFIRPTPPATHKSEVSKPIVASPSVTPPAPVAPSGMATSPTAPPVSAPAPVTPSSSFVAPAPNVPAFTAPPPAKAESATKAEAAKADSNAAAATPAKGEALLQFRFTGESWVEVRDAADKVVFQKLNPADSEATVTGKLPLHVIVGNAEEVRLRYNGRDYPLAPYTKVAVARFTLE